MMGVAPTSAPPWTALSPTPPQPQTARLAPVGTLAVHVTAPTPVVTEQPMSAACSSGMSLRMGMAQLSGTTVSEE